MLPQQFFSFLSFSLLGGLWEAGGGRDGEGGEGLTSEGEGTRQGEGKVRMEGCVWGGGGLGRKLTEPGKHLPVRSPHPCGSS